MSETLAIHGGPPAILDPLPHFSRLDGRSFGEDEERLVLEVLHSGCLSRNGGVTVSRLEEEFARALGVGAAVACSSGTASVHLAVAALDPEPGDEFIVPPITDIGSVFPILWQNAVPVFADVDPRTMTLDPAEVERNISPRTRAVIAVHLAGQPCELGALRALCDRHGLTLIEDCSQAYWAEYEGRLAGTVGDIACFSLQQSKHITCGEGGLIATSHAGYARRAALFADKAWPREVNTLGSSRFLFLAQNYRMSELQGAVALAQLGKVRWSVARRRERAAQLSTLLAGLPAVSPPYVSPHTNPSYWLYMLRINESEAGASTAVFGDALVAEGVPAWVRYIVEPLYRSPVFAGQRTYGASGYPLREFARQSYERGLCPRAEQALANVIAIHWNENYTESHVSQVAAAILKVARHFAGAPVR